MLCRMPYKYYKILILRPIPDVTGQPQLVLAQQFFPYVYLILIYTKLSMYLEGEKVNNAFKFNKKN